MIHWVNKMQKYTKSFLLTSFSFSIFYILLLFYFFVTYSEFTRDKIYKNIDEYLEIDAYHICNVTGCKAIYLDGIYYAKDISSGKISYGVVDNIKLASQLFEYNGISIRNDMTFIIQIIANNGTEFYFIVDTENFYSSILVVFILSLFLINFLLYILLKLQTNRELVIYDIELSKNKAKLQFDNLMYFIENINHEVNSPLFILTKKLNEVKKNCEFKNVFDERTENNIKIMFDAIEQINSVMQRTREVKRINKNSEDRTIFDLIASTMITVKIIRSEEFECNISEELNMFVLNQTLLNNGTFINIITNHVKNSIEACSTKLSVEFVEFKNGYISFDFIDDGNGVEPSLRSKIFKKGFTTKLDGSEHGSGLSINKDILESVGGSIEILDIPETTFRINIPAKKQVVEKK